jgi:uncharacterized membrane protein YccC
MSEHLSAWSIGLSPRALSLQEGLRAAIACALVVALMQVLDWPALAWAAIAALWTCLADPGGPARRRAWVLIAYAAASCLFAMAGAGSAALGLPWAAATVFACALLSGAASAWGPAARQAAALALVACVVAADFPAQDGPALLRFGAIFMAGNAWAVLLTLTLWRSHPYRPARLALAAVFQALAALALHLGAARPPPPHGLIRPDSPVLLTGRRRSAVRTAIETARRAVDELARARRDGPVLQRMRFALETAERIFTHLIALEDMLQTAPAGEAHPRQFRRLALVLARYGAPAEPDPARHAALVVRARAAFASQKWQGTPALLAVLADLDDLDGTIAPDEPWAPPETRQRLLGLIAAELHGQSMLLRHAVRGALLVTSVLVLTHLLGLPEAYWATMAVILVQQGQPASTWPRALERSLGSVAGGALSALLGWALVSPWLLTAAVFPLAMATMALRTVNYALFVMFLTPLFVLVTELTQPGASHLALAWQRVANNVLGSAVALSGTFLLWPAWERPRLAILLADAIEANGAYAMLAFRANADALARDEARRMAGLASVRAETSRDQTALESAFSRGRGRLQQASRILFELRQMTGGVTAAWLHPLLGSGPDDAVADWLGAATAQLAEALRQGSPAGLTGAPVPPQVGRAQAQAVQRVVYLQRMIRDFLAV